MTSMSYQEKAVVVPAVLRRARPSPVCTKVLVVCSDTDCKGTTAMGYKHRLSRQEIFLNAYIVFNIRFKKKLNAVKIIEIIFGIIIKKWTNFKRL